MFRKLYLSFITALSAIKTLPPLIKIKRLKDKNPKKKKEMVSKVTHKFGDRVMKACGKKIIVNGIENMPVNEPVLYVANHASLYDIPLLLKLVHDQIGFIAKIELEKLPIANSWITEMNGLFLDRDDQRQSLQVMKKAVDLLKAGHSLVIFPQGTREKDENISFKGGSFSIAKKAQAPVVPIAIDGTSNLLKNKSKASNITVTFLNRFYITKQDNVNDIAKNVEADIRNEIKKNKVLVKSK